MCGERAANSAVRASKSPKQAAFRPVVEWHRCNLTKERLNETNCHGYRRTLSVAGARGTISSRGAGRSHRQDESEGWRRGAGFYPHEQQVGKSEAERFSRQEKCHPGLLRPGVHWWLNEGTSGLSG